MNKFIYTLIVYLLITGQAYSQIIYKLTDTASLPEIYLEETIIKGIKERTTLREIPGSVSIITSRSISENNVSTIRDVTSLAPNFFMPDYGSRLTAPVYIRGIGSRINEPSIGLYVDNIPYFDKSVFDFELMDIDRIEILKGPQGTLYGRNTMGGIINVITRSPLNYVGTKFTASTGSQGQYQAGISHYNRFNQDLGYSVSLNYRYSDGFYTNQFNDSKVDQLNLLGIRNRFAWTIHDKLTAESMLAIESSRQGGYPYALITDTESKTGVINYDYESSYNRDMISGGLVIKYQANQFELITTTSYQYLDDFQDVDQDFTSQSLFLANQKQRQHLFSQETVIKSVSKKRYDWLFGSYGFSQDFGRDVNVSSLTNNLLINRNFGEIKYGVALFHQSSIHRFILTNLSLIAGIRYDLETNKLAFGNNLWMNGNPISELDTVFPRVRFSVFSPKIAFNYTINKDMNAYALVSKGYKTGGFNAIYERDEDLIFDPEESWNYEMGVKGSFLQDKLHMEASFFLIDWTNQQIYQTNPSGIGAILKNAGRTESKGYELSARARMNRNLEAVLAYGYTKAVFVSHVVNATTDYSGNFVPYVPRHTLAVQLNQTIHFSGNPIIDRLKITGLLRGLGKHYWNDKNSNAQDAYGILDLKVRIEKQNIGLELWGRNITNNNYSAFYFEALNNQYFQPSKPFHFGLNLLVTI